MCKREMRTRGDTVRDGCRLIVLFILDHFHMVQHLVVLCLMDCPTYHKQALVTLLKIGAESNVVEVGSFRLLQHC
jgi:hypothetical protein